MHDSWHAAFGHESTVKLCTTAIHLGPILVPNRSHLPTNCPETRHGYDRQETTSMHSMSVCCHSQLQVVIMHRSVFESLMRTLKGHLLYQAEYLSRLLVKPPTTRSEAEVLKLASYLTSLPRFQEVPQSQLVQVAKEVTYLELTAGATVCKQGPTCLHKLMV